MGIVLNVRRIRIGKGPADFLILHNCAYGFVHGGSYSLNLNFVFVVVEKAKQTSHSKETIWHGHLNRFHVRRSPMAPMGNGYGTSGVIADVQDSKSSILGMAVLDPLCHDVAAERPLNYRVIFLLLGLEMIFKKCTRPAPRPKEVKKNRKGAVYCSVLGGMIAFRCAGILPLHYRVM